MKKIYITGVSGTGKSTIVEELNKRGVFSFDIDEIKGLCTWINKKTKKIAETPESTKEWLETYDWVCDVEKLKNLICKDINLIVVAGVASNQNDYIELFDKTFLLKCNETVFLKRLQERYKAGGNIFGKDVREREYILTWYKDFENKLINMGAVVIDAEKPINEVVNQILSKI